MGKGAERTQLEIGHEGGEGVSGRRRRDDRIILYQVVCDLVPWLHT